MTSPRTTPVESLEGFLQGWVAIVCFSCPSGFDRVLIEYAQVLAPPDESGVLALEFPDALRPLLDLGWAESLHQHLCSRHTGIISLCVTYGEAKSSIAASRLRERLRLIADDMDSLILGGLVAEMVDTFQAMPNIESIRRRA